MTVESPLRRIARTGLWALPVYALLLMLGTLTEQPDPRLDFGAYAGYITTPTFLASHILASILGSAFGILGFVSLWVLVTGDRGVALPTAGLVSSVVGVTLITSVFGAATFAQPAIGRAFLAGGADAAVAFDSDVYGPPLFGVALSGIALFALGAVLLGLAVARHDRRLRWLGIAYLVLLPLYAVSGLMFNGVQWMVAGLLTLATAALALRLGRLAAPTAG
jgi:hypothetical protein